jgi:hypothetical protein
MFMHPFFWLTWEDKVWLSALNKTSLEETKETVTYTFLKNPIYLPKWQTDGHTQIQVTYNYNKHNQTSMIRTFRDMCQ